MRLRLSRLALEDIDRIDAYTVAHWGTEQSDKYIHALWMPWKRFRIRPSAGVCDPISVLTAVHACAVAIS